MARKSKTGLIKLAPDAWAVVTSILPPEGGGPNSGFILAGDQVLVIDSGMSPSIGRQMAEYLRQVTDKPATYLINTHNHGDHVFGNQAFCPPATIIAHDYVREVLTSQGETMVKASAERFASLVPDVKDTRVVLPHVTFSDRMTLDFGGRVIELIHSGVAHSHGDIMVFLPADRVLYAGDLVFNHIFPPILGSSAGWIGTLEEIEAMEVDTIVPGHGFIATKKEIGDLKRCLMALRKQVKNYFDRGFAVEEAAKKIDIPYLKWPRTERLGPDVSLIYEELAEEALG